MLPNDILQKISERPRAVTTLDIFRGSIIWRWGLEADGKYGTEVIKLVLETLVHFPDKEQERREAEARTKSLDQFIAMASKQRREKQQAVFKECWDAVCDVTTGQTVRRGRGDSSRVVPEMLCQPFMALPRKTVSHRVQQLELTNRLAGVS